MSANPQIGWRREVWFFLFCPLVVIGIFIISSLVGSLLVMVLGGLPVERFFNINPVYPLPIVIGLATGLLLNRRLFSRSVPFVWLLFSIPIWWDIWDYRHMSYPGFHGTLHYLFSPHCGDCFEQTLTVAPFSISVAFSLGAWIALRRRYVNPQTPV